MSDPRFCDFFGGAKVDPAVVAAGHAAFEEAVSVASTALAAVCRGDAATAGRVTAQFLLPVDPVGQVGRHNALFSVLLAVAAQLVCQRGDPAEGVVLTLVAAPDASPARRAVLTAIGYAAARDTGAALDVLLAHKAVAGDVRVGLIGEFLLITAHLVGGPVQVVTQPWPGVER